jgi:hypothetical protein
MSFNTQWYVIEILLPEYSTPFCTNVKWVEGKCRLCLYRVLLMLWNSELDINSSLFLLTKTSNQYMYWEGSGSIWSCLNSWRHDSRLPVFVQVAMKYNMQNLRFSHWCCWRFSLLGCYIVWVDSSWFLTFLSLHSHAAQEDCLTLNMKALQSLETSYYLPITNTISQKTWIFMCIAVASNFVRRYS